MNVLDLQRALAQLKALRNLSFIDASFLPRIMPLLEPFRDIEVLVVEGGIANWPWPTSPHVFYALRMFRNIERFVLRGRVTDWFNPLGDYTTETRIRHMQWDLVDCQPPSLSHIIYGLRNMAVSVKTINFDNMAAMHWKTDVDVLLFIISSRFARLHYAIRYDLELVARVAA